MEKNGSLKFSKSQALFQRSQKVTPGGVHSPVRAFQAVRGTPFFTTHAKGAFLYDIDGNSFLDFCSSWGPLIFGHAQEELVELLKKAVSQSTSFGTAEPYSLELAEWITNALPWVEKIRFVNSGTEAVLSALRIARAATGRSLILKFSGCYHGHIDSLLVQAGSGLAGTATPTSAGISKATASETKVLPLADEARLEAAFSQYGSELAACIIEPLPANCGLLPQKKSFLKKLEKLTHQHGALLILDEVISGFRIGFGGMSEKLGIFPDLITFGKIIGGGFPVGAYGGKKEYLDLVAPTGPVYQAGTLSANPIAMQAGLWTLKKLKQENPYPALEKTTQAFAEKVRTKIFSKLQNPLTIEQEGSLFWIALGTSKQADKVFRASEDIDSKQNQFFAFLFQKLLKENIFFPPSGYEVCFVSTAHKESHLEHVFHVLKKALHAWDQYDTQEKSHQIKGTSS